MSALALALMLAAAASTDRYDCQLDAPLAVSTEVDGKSSRIGLPDSLLRFGLAIDRTPNDISIKIDWPGNPFQIAGTFKAIQTGPGAIAGITVSGGPCMFTEQACMATIHLVEQADGSALVIIAPIALTRDTKTNVRSPFAVAAQGRCTKEKAAK